MSNVSNPVSPSDWRVAPSANSSGSTPMPTRFERWMRSKISAITARTPSSSVPLAAQSRDEPVPYSLPAMTIERRAVLLVRHRRVVDELTLAAGLGASRPAALRARRQLVAQADVGERAAHHHLVIAATRAVRVEVLLLDAVRDRAIAPPGSSPGCCRPARCDRS